MGLPPDVIGRLDGRQFRPLALDAAAELSELGRRMNAHLVVYAKDAEATESDHLCRLLVAAELDAAEIDELAEVERRLGGDVVVAYARPARRRA
jgi:hypothetical protein